MQKIAKALLEAQQDLMKVVVTKDSTNPHFGNKYADLSSVIEAVIPVLNKHGITVIQLPVNPPFEGTLALSTALLHESGEQLVGTLVVPLDKQNAQGIGSAITYARRYSLASVLGLKQEDDDGEAASGGKTAQASKTQLGTGRQMPTFRKPEPAAKGNAKAPARKGGKMFGGKVDPDGGGDESGEGGEQQE